MYRHFIRPLLFRLNPEAAHKFTLSMLKFFRKIPGGKSILRGLYRKKTPSLSREVFSLNFPNPVGIAAGLDKDGEYYNDLADLGFAFIEIGSLTPRPQDGNPRPRLYRLPKDKALINRMGLNNKGINNAINHISADRPNLILAASLAKNSTSVSDEEIARDYYESFFKLYDFVDMFTLNVSCPNVEGMQVLQESSYLSDIIDPLLELRVCFEEYKPLLVKVSPDLPKDQLKDVLDYCLMSGVDGIVAGNTTRSREGLQTDPEKIEKTGNGGLSGAPLFERSLAQVKFIKEYTRGRLPIIGVGGIMSPEQAAQMLAAGASLVEVYTGFIYEGPSFCKDILKYLKKNGI